MSHTKRSLLVVAHPDDESLFFGGLLISRPGEFDVVCVTDGNGAGRAAERAVEFAFACEKMKVAQHVMWQFADTPFARIDVQKLCHKLSQLDTNKYEDIFTHGPVGEYGHPHHQDVSFAVYKTFAATKKIYSPAYNCAAEFSVTLTTEQAKIKQEVLWDIYSKEIERFVNFLPMTPVEGFIGHGFAEVEAIYELLTKNKQPNADVCRNYAWLMPYLRGGNLARSVDKFLKIT